MFLFHNINRALHCYFSLKLCIAQYFEFFVGFYDKAYHYQLSRIYIPSFLFIILFFFLMKIYIVYKENMSSNIEYLIQLHHDGVITIDDLKKGIRALNLPDEPIPKPTEPKELALENLRKKRKIKSAKNKDVQWQEKRQLQRHLKRYSHGNMQKLLKMTEHYVIILKHMELMRIYIKTLLFCLMAKSPS